jgi:putative tricarboxylic transport membrane protein
MIPALALGIPTNPGMAIFLMALLLHGVAPGPLLIPNQPEVFWGLIASMYIGNVILIILNVPLVSIFVSILRVPFSLLFPMILLICLVGIYTLNSSTFEMMVLLVAGLLGYFFRKFNYNLAPFILALIIGPRLEEALRQSLMSSGGSFAIFWQSPIALAFIILSFLIFAWNVFRMIRPKSQLKDEVLKKS